VTNDQLKAIFDLGAELAVELETDETIVGGSVSG